ncbi:MAG: hypothetical protein KDI15_14505, partial [Thiothrix sp.]|nr:hypothetical protein [Thiothrix sp.]
NGSGWNPGWSGGPNFNWGSGNGWNPGWSGGPNFNWGNGSGWNSMPWSWGNNGGNWNSMPWNRGNNWGPGYYPPVWQEAPYPQPGIPAPGLPHPGSQPQSRLSPPPATAPGPAATAAAPAPSAETGTPAATGNDGHFAPLPEGTSNPASDTSVFPKAEDIPADVDNAPENAAEPAAAN